MSFQSQFSIHFDECDPAGIVFFGHQFRFAHRLVEGYVQDAGISWNEWFESKEFGVPLVHAEADYRAPLFGGQSYLGRVQIKNIGESSVTFLSKIETLDGKPCSSLTTVHVFIDLKTQKKISIPKNIRDILS